MPFSRMKDRFSRKVTQTGDQASLNNLLAALQTVEGAEDRHRSLVDLRNFFEQHPEYRELSPENRTFYEDFLSLAADTSSASRAGIGADPLQWPMIVEYSRKLKT